MTTITADQAVVRTTPASGRRIWRIVRLNLVNKMTTIWLPVMIMTFIWIVNYAIWWIIWAATPPAQRAEALDHTQYSGAGFYIFIYMLVVGVTIIAMTFPFALGYSVTRRDFYLGTSLTFGLLAAGYSIAFTLLAYIEEWTNGWGIGGHLFTSIYFGDTLWERLFTVFVGLLFCFFLGSTSAIVFTRWKVNGLLTAMAILVIILLGAVALITFTNNWPAVGDWFVSAGPVGVVAWLLVPTAVGAVAGFFLLRRATPKS